MHTTFQRHPNNTAIAAFRTAAWATAIAAITACALPGIARAAENSCNADDHALRAAQIEAQLAGADTAGPQIY